MAPEGVEVYLLQLLARHSGITVLRYVQVATLEDLTEAARAEDEKRVAADRCDVHGGARCGKPEVPMVP